MTILSVQKGNPDASNIVWVEGQSINAVLARSQDGTSAVISWNIPNASVGAQRAYNGALVLANVSEINPSNYPTDGVRYSASTDLSNPNHKIGSAQVVGAFYNDVTTNQISVTNLDPNIAYYFSVHLISNVWSYYTPGSKTYPVNVLTDAFAGSIPQSISPPVNPTLGEYYYDTTNLTLFSWDGAQWSPTIDHNPKTGDNNPDQGTFIGDIFYNIRERQLKTWNGAQWVSAEPDSTRMSMTSKLNVGSDLSTDERTNLIDILKKQLGYPKVCTDLLDEHFNIAIDNAIEEIRHRVDNAYWRQYVPLRTIQGQQIYYLNDPKSGTNRVVDVIKIHRLNLMGMSTLGESGIYAQSFLNQLFYPGAQVDLATIFMIHQYSEMFNYIFAGSISFNWRETTRQLTLFRRIASVENMLIECSMEKTEQELLQDRWLKQWIQQWAEAEAMLMQGRIRSKYPSLPGPGGGLSLNGADLIAEAQGLQTDCLRQIMDMEVGNGGAEFGNYSFTIG